MVDKPRYSVVSVNDFYPTPQLRIESPTETPLLRGDLVKILIGPAIDKIGEVVVERNGNYSDSEPYCSAESIGVQVVELAKIDPVLMKALGGIANMSDDGLSETAVRWFDSPDQLELVLRPEVITEV